MQEDAAAFVAAVRSAAERWQVNLATVVDIAARYEEQLRAAAESRPTPETLYDRAFAEFALGDSPPVSARRAANLALELLQKQPMDELFHREAALNALLLLHEAAKLLMTRPLRLPHSKRRAPSLTRKPLHCFWWKFTNRSPTSCSNTQKLDRSDNLISDIIDIREERQGEYHPDLAGQGSEC